MTNEELNRLDGSLSAQLKNLDEDIQALDKRIKETNFFKKVGNRAFTKRSVKRLEEQKAKLEQFSSAIQELQNAISVSDPTKRASVEVQKAAYDKLVDLEKEINFDSAETPLRVSTEKSRTSLRNTLETMNNRRLSANLGRIIGINAAIVFGLPIIAFAGNLLGLGAIFGALAPVTWGAIAFGVARGAYQIISSRLRKKFAARNNTTYENLYPTLPNVKGFANTLGYFRGLRRSVGKRFDAMTDNRLFNKLSNSGFVQGGTQDDSTKKNSNQNDASKSLEERITQVVAEVRALDITKKDEVEAIVNEVDTLYAAVQTASGVVIKNHDLLELCNSYIKIVRDAHDGKINETLVSGFLNQKGTSPEFKALKDELVNRVEQLLESMFGNTLSQSTRDMFDQYKNGPSLDQNGKKSGAKPDPIDLNNQNQNPNPNPNPNPDPNQNPKPNPDPGQNPDPNPNPNPNPNPITPDKVKDEINDILNKMLKSTTSDDFAQLLEQLNNLIKNNSTPGLESSLDNETKIMLTMLKSYISFSEQIRSGSYDNPEFSNNLRSFMDPKNEASYSPRVKTFRWNLIKQLNALVKDELKINDSHLVGLIDYGYENRLSGSFGKSAEQRTLINNIQKFDLRNFSRENVSLARDIIDEVSEYERNRVSQNEFYLDNATMDALNNIKMFSSVDRDRDRLSSQIKACQAIMRNPNGYDDDAQKSTLEGCIKSYYHLVGFVNNILSNEYQGYEYQDKNGVTKTRDFGDDGIRAAVDLGFISSREIEPLKKIMEFYKNNELKLNANMSRQGQYMEDYLDSHSARR